jgi:hypothetical protein
MRRKWQIIPTSAVVLLLMWFMADRDLVVAADTANTPSLTISQLKITSSSGQFITLYNPANAAVDMSRYQLQYFNSYDLAKSTSSRLIPLSGTVPPHGYFMVNDSALLLCYELTVDSVSLGLSSTAGMVEVLGFSQSMPGGAVSPVLQDYVSWSKTPAVGAQTLPVNTNAFLQRMPVDAGNNPAVKSPGTGSWQTVQPDDSNGCNLKTSAGLAVPTPSGLGQLLPPTEPPATIASLATANDEAPATIPTSDLGLKSPQITELLPNPNGTGNDSTDEFIELYNSNDKAFDLSGFVLQTGLTRVRSYTFANGTSLQAHSFKAFYSDTTDLSLSNTSGMAKLLDPLGNSIASTEAYSTAKDGQAWALAKGKWYWTTEPTPNKQNVIKQAVPKKLSSSKSKSSKLQTKSTAPGTAIGAAGQDETNTIPVHTRTLALVVGLAILYGAYEYRADARNKLHQLRRYIGARQADRRASSGKRGD